MTHRAGSSTKSSLRISNKFADTISSTTIPLPNLIVPFIREASFTMALTKGLMHT